MSVPTQEHWKEVRKVKILTQIVGVTEKGIGCPEFRVNNNTLKTKGFMNIQF